MKQKIIDIFQEFKKVQWPSWDALQNDSIVVAIASLIIAIVIFGMDSFFSSILEEYYSDIVFCFRNYGFIDAIKCVFNIK